MPQDVVDALGRRAVELLPEFTPQALSKCVVAEKPNWVWLGLLARA
jgi:hypothetical protein